MSIENKLTYLNNTKNAIKQAIIDKGVEISDSDTFRSYATKIGDIEGGGTSGGNNTLKLANMSDLTSTVSLVGLILSNISDITFGQMDGLTMLSTIVFNNPYIKKIEFTSNLNTIIDSYYYLASNCENLTKITLPNEMKSISTMPRIAYNCPKLSDVTFPSTLEGITAMASSDYVFGNNCGSITVLRIPDMPNVTNMALNYDGIIANLTNLQELYFGNYPKQWQVSNLSITNLSTLKVLQLPTPNFYKGLYLSNLGILSLSISENTVLNKFVMTNCSSITTLTLGNIPNISTLENRDLPLIKEINFNMTSLGVSAISYLAYNCPNVTTLTIPKLTNISILKINNFTLDTINFLGFGNKLNTISCSYNTGIKNIIIGDCSDSFSLSLVSAFYARRDLETLDLSKMNNTYITNLNGAFGGNISLRTLKLPNMSNVSNLSSTFYLCSSLETLEFIDEIYPYITTLTNWGISTCTSLTVESLVNIMNALPTITSSKTCTIGTTNISKLSAEQLKIGTDKGWTIN